MTQRGAAMVEFAMVLPILIMLLFGITELGRALYQQSNLYKAVTSGARYMARTNATLDETNCSITDDWADDTDDAVNLIIYGNIAGTGTPLLPHLDSNTKAKITITPRSETLTMGDGEDKIICIITVSAEVDFAGLFGDIAIPFTNIGAFKIRAETEERYIGL